LIVILKELLDMYKPREGIMRTNTHKRCLVKNNSKSLSPDLLETSPIYRVQNPLI